MVASTSIFIMVVRPRRSAAVLHRLEANCNAVRGDPRRRWPRDAPSSTRWCSHHAPVAAVPGVVPRLVRCAVARSAGCGNESIIAWTSSWGTDERLHGRYICCTHSLLCAEPHVRVWAGLGALTSRERLQHRMRCTAQRFDGHREQNENPH